ncbi:hypothetical protein KAR91_14055 [Candidatus Pacearchaeota archaeon]|nr:hypothetical protein [Candidatus Pacearchaeota archaeon]
MSDFPTINRDAITIEPSEGYFEWTKACPEPDPKLTLEELQVESKTFLIPETDAEPEKWLKRNFNPIFKRELWGWDMDESYFPEKMTYKLFKEFFNIRFSTVVVDMGK